MRILVIGGAGEMGKYSCRILAAAYEADEVLIADRNAERAAQLAGEVRRGAARRRQGLRSRQLLD